MHKIRFPVGLHLRPHLSAPPDPLAGFKGPVSKGGKGKEGWEEEGRVRKRGLMRGKEGGQEGRGREEWEGRRKEKGGDVVVSGVDRGHDTPP